MHAASQVGKNEKTHKRARVAFKTFSNNDTQSKQHTASNKQDRCVYGIYK